MSDNFSKCFQMIGQLAAIAICFLNTTNLSATDPLRESLSGAAIQIKKVLEAEGADSISLGVIIASNGDNVVSFGRRVTEFLRAELEHEGVNIPAKANLRLMGTYFVDSDSGLISIKLDIVEKNGKTVSSLASGKFDANLLRAETNDTREILFASNASIVVQSSDSPREIIRTVEAQSNKPSGLTIDSEGYLVVPELGLGMRLKEVNPAFSSFEEWFVVKIVSAKSVDAPHFQLSKLKSYAIDLKNTRGDIDFAVEVLFDGIDTFVLCDDSEKKADEMTGKKQPRYQFWKIGMQSSLSVPGWYKNLTKVSAFQIVPDAKSVAYRLGETQGIGTIQVVVRAAWPKGKEVAEKFKSATTKDGAGEGETIEVNLKPEVLETGTILGSISAQYETN